MKNTKTCPKCGGTKLLRVEDVCGERGMNLVLGWFSSVPVTRYVCCDCGYTESWVDQEHMPDIRKQYEKQK